MEPNLPKLMMILALACGPLWTSSAWAEEPDEEPAEDGAQETESAKEKPRRYGEAFNGSFVELSVRGAPTTGPGDAWAVDVGLRQAFPFLLADTRVAYRYDRFVPEGLARLEAHEIAVQGALHPLYLFLLGSDWISYLASSFYFEIGLGAHFGVADFTESTEQDLGFTWSLGTGIDIPLSDPDAGWAPWLNVLYRYRGADFDSDTLGEIELGSHAIFIGFAIRKNGLLF